MHSNQKDGYMLLDSMISLVVIALITTTVYRFYYIFSDCIRCTSNYHHGLQNVMQTIDHLTNVHKHTDFSVPREISVRYVPLSPETMQGKPPGYSFDFESNFAFVIVTTDMPLNNTQLTLVSSTRKP